MAWIFGDSFDHYATADLPMKYTQVVPGDGPSPLIAAVGARSTNGFKTAMGAYNGLPGHVRYVPDSPAPSGDTVIVGVRYRMVSSFAGTGDGLTPGGTYFGAYSSFLFVAMAATVQLFWLRQRTNGQLSVMRGTTVLGTTTIALVQNVWAYLELKVKLHASTGTVDLRINGVTALSLTGQTTTPGAVVWDEFMFGGCPGGTAGLEANYDDLYVLDGSGGDTADLLGDVRIDAIFPNAVGTHSDWTRSTGADQWATIDEAAANGDTDYNSTATLNAIDTLNFPTVPVAGATILAVQLNAQARKTDAGSAGLKGVTRIGSTDYLGTERAVPSSYALLRQAWTLKPSDSTPWIDTDVNAAEFGYKKST